MNGRWYRTTVVILVVVLLAVAGWFTVLRPHAQLTIKAEFTATAGLFAGNKVTQLGMPVGTVESVRPHGTTSTVTFTVPESTAIPAGAQAYIMSPDVISDQHLELTPTYRNGPRMRDGAVIPVTRTHAPIAWDQLVSTLDNLATTFGPTAGNPRGVLGSALGDTASALDGNGGKLRDAIRNISQASSVVVSHAPDAKRLLGSLNGLIGVINDNQSAIDSLSGTVTALTGEYQAHQDAVGGAVGELTRLLKQASELIDSHGDRLDPAVRSFTGTTQLLSDLRHRLVDTLDYLPLAAQNLSRAVVDRQVRLRLNVSTNLQQFASGHRLCRALPNPLCTGPGLVNPIPAPMPSSLDPLGVFDFSRGPK